MTDPETRLMPGRRGWKLDYNAQVAVDSRHQIIAAANVTDQTVDTYQLIPLLEQGKKTTGRCADTTLADCGYCAGENLKGAEDRTDLLIPDPRHAQKVNGPKGWPYHKDHFQDDAETDTYTCTGTAPDLLTHDEKPQQTLRYVRVSLSRVQRLPLP